MSVDRISGGTHLNKGHGLGGSELSRRPWVSSCRGLEPHTAERASSKMTRTATAIAPTVSIRVIRSIRPPTPLIIANVGMAGNPEMCEERSIDPQQWREAFCSTKEPVKNPELALGALWALDS